MSFAGRVLSSAAGSLKPAPGDSFAQASSRLVFRFVAYAFATFFVITSLAAIIWLLYSSLKSDAEWWMSPWALPKAFRWQHYVDAWTKAQVGRYFLNSAYLTVLGTLGQLCLATPAAYAIARLPSGRWGRVLLFYFLMAFMLPGFTGLIPKYLLMKNLNLLDSHIGLLLLWWSGISLEVFILTGFFRSLPTELEEAAAIDGASPFRTFWRIIIPMVGPPVMTLAIFDFLGIWNDFFTPLVFVAEPELWTLPVGVLMLQYFSVLYTNFGLVFAALIILMAPPLLVFLVLQERVMAGISFSGLKG